MSIVLAILGYLALGIVAIIGIIQANDHVFNYDLIEDVADDNIMVGLAIFFWPWIVAMFILVVISSGVGYLFNKAFPRGGK